MAVYLDNGMVLLDSGLVATSSDCCCGGGCCFGDFGCLDLNQSDCLAAGGFPVSGCGPESLLGCCRPDGGSGDCVTTTQDICVTLGGGIFVSGCGFCCGAGACCNYFQTCCSNPDFDNHCCDPGYECCGFGCCNSATEACLQEFGLCVPM